MSMIPDASELWDADRRVFTRITQQAHYCQDPWERKRCFHCKAMVSQHALAEQVICLGCQRDFRNISLWSEHDCRGLWINPHQEPA